MNGKKRVKYLVLKVIITALQVINMLIWFWYTLMEILFLPKAIKKEGYFPYIWTFAVCITMVSAFLLTLSCYRDSFNIVSVIIGILSFIILIYITGGILLSTGLARPSEEVQLPLVRYYLVFIAFWMVIFYLYMQQKWQKEKILVRRRRKLSSILKCFQLVV